MNKISRLAIFISALILASSCQDESGLNPGEREVTLTAGISGKTVIDGNAVKWEDGDRIALVFTHSSGSRHRTEFATEIEDGKPVTSARFRGTLHSSVSVAGGYNASGFSVYPHDAVTDDGQVSYTLPAVQTASADASFAGVENLSSAVVSLSDIDANDETNVVFRNALSILRFKLSSDVTSFSITGTAPMAGKAPLSMHYTQDDHFGRLMVDSNGQWSDASNTVSIVPAGGAANFTDGQVCNLLVWPGTHTSLTLSMTFKDYGNYEKKTTKQFVFEPAKYYTLNFSSDCDEIVTELSGDLGSIEAELPELSDRVEGLDELRKLLSQVQSVALMSEYSDNTVLASYAMLQYGMQKMDVELNYLIRPASVAAELVENYSNAFSAIVCYPNSGNYEFYSLPVSSLEINDDILSVKVNASGIRDSFYKESVLTKLALVISDGTSEVASDFAKLHPVSSIMLNFSKTENIPAIEGASVSVPFSFGVTSSDYTIEVVDKNNIANAYVTSTYDYKSGSLNVRMNESSADGAWVDVKLTCGESSQTVRVSFTDIGDFSVTNNGPLDHIGGEIMMTVNSTLPSTATYIYGLDGGSGWASQVSASGIVFSAGENTGSQRTATVNFDISYQGVRMTKSAQFVQKAAGSPLSREYYSDGHIITLNEHDPKYGALNLLIFGDGYKKKDLTPGGKFERSAISAMNAFFSLEPLKSFKDRFDVKVVVQSSNAEGLDNKAAGTNYDTYFETWCNSSSDTYVNMTESGRAKLVALAQTAIGYGTAAYCKTASIVLINTSENVGSTTYDSQTTLGNNLTVGDGFKTFGISLVPANISRTSELVRHEGAGHAFGRLGDEYTNYTVDRVRAQHTVGFYRNISPDMTSWQRFYDAGYTTSEVDYLSTGANPTYRSTSTGIMYDNKGQFNAVSRYYIYERIILQSEGSSAASSVWNNFVTYDRINRTN